MATESKSFHLQIDADVRLAAAAGGVAKYLADEAGLETNVAAQLQAAVIAASCESFSHLSADHPHLEVTVTRFVDRIEVALSCFGEAAPAVGLDVIAGFAAHPGGQGVGSEFFAGVDRVQYEMHGSEAVTRLTKYINDV